MNWQKSTYSSNGTNTCVEVTVVETDQSFSPR
ncbi:DUF397 domain-containing protein [Actinoallomurus sp. NBC_01490]